MSGNFTLSILHVPLPHNARICPELIELTYPISHLKTPRCPKRSVMFRLGMLGDRLGAALAHAWNAHRQKCGLFGPTETTNYHSSRGNDSEACEKASATILA